MTGLEKKNKLKELEEAYVNAYGVDKAATARYDKEAHIFAVELSRIERRYDLAYQDSIDSGFALANAKAEYLDTIERIVSDN